MASRWRPIRTGAVDPSWGFYALGIAGLALAIGHPLTEGVGPGTVLEALILAVLAAFSCYTGYELHDRALSRRGAARAFAFTCLFAAAFVLLALAIVLVWHVEHGQAQETQFVVVFAGVLGTAVGGRACASAFEYQEAFDRNQELTKLLTVNQRVLRHNLRNEVTIVLGYLEGVEESAEVKLVRQHLDDLLETSQEARRISGIWERDAIDEFDVSALLAERVEALRSEFPTAEVAVECDDPPLVRGHVALPMAIDELLENAVVHNDIDVEITAFCERTDGGVRIEIADTGNGIPEEESDVLFRSAETELEHGTGLGLWLVYWTVQQSDGELAFRKSDSGGNVVEIVLPGAS